MPTQASDVPVVTVSEFVIEMAVLFHKDYDLALHAIIFYLQVVSFLLDQRIHYFQLGSKFAHLDQAIDLTELLHLLDGPSSCFPQRTLHFLHCRLCLPSRGIHCFAHGIEGPGKGVEIRVHLVKFIPDLC